ncbi:MAG: SAM-dependent methyltransferase [Erysipelotrichaceae bacterium]|jgi:adenine-specific DNA-methyltransferase|nr:SAM-dependent methyltransferase [Erysipelotrichaceae bacterium]
MTRKKEKETNKTHGRIYTPAYVVDNILDFASYRGENVIKKHVIDNSCGDGAFLTRIITEYCESFLKLSNDKNELKHQLELYIHGIELDRIESELCKNNLRTAALRYGIKDYDPDVICGDTLTISKFDGMMDFVLGNPPYVRVHNLGDSYSKIKEFRFSDGGMTDLYIAFYEIGLRMLSQNGILSYIAPSSWFTSVAGAQMRKYFEENKSIKSLCDLKHFQPFNATTYTCILTLTKIENDSFAFFLYDDKNHRPVYLTELTYKDINIDGGFYFAKKNELSVLKKIMNCFYLRDDAEVKNGFATLCDSVYIAEKFPFHSKYIIPVYKASTAQWKQCIFPYEQSKVISLEKMEADRKLSDYLIQFREELENRSLDKKASWFSFGRTQGINDVNKEKIAINALLRDVNDIKVEIIKPGSGVYSGLYILSSFSLEKIIAYIKTEEFVSYISLLGKYKSGGYYTFSSKDMKRFLKYKISEERKNG